MASIDPGGAEPRAGDAGGAAGPAGLPILQIHPSLRCNLACRHCYSVSGPQASLELETAAVLAAIDDAAALGYRVVSVSGGEPLLYRGLPSVLERAKRLGLRTTVTTNGFFSRDERFRRLRGLVDVLAISLDGPPPLHDEIRGRAGAFDRLVAGLDAVRAAEIPFGFIHTLTRRSFPHLGWVADFALRQGAKLLQIHPLESAGRAATDLRGEGPDDDLLARAYVFAYALGAHYDGLLKVQLDLVHRDLLRDAPGSFYAADAATGTDDVSAASSLGLVVLEPDGSLVPVSFGFSRDYRVANVHEARFAAAWPEYRKRTLPRFQALCRSTWEELTAPDAPLLVNWHEAIVAASRGADGSSRRLPLAG